MPDPLAAAAVTASGAGADQESGSEEDADSVRAALNAVCTFIEQNMDGWNKLDAKVGDGDTGTQFQCGAEALSKVSSRTPAALFLEIGKRLGQAMGGSSGVLLSVMFTRMGSVLKEDPSAKIQFAFQQGIQRMQEYGGAVEGDRTCSHFNRANKS